MIEIPLNNSPEQLFNIVINNSTYDIKVMFNSRNRKWTISISKEDIDIVLGVALMSGIDIFNQYNIDWENGYVINFVNSRQDASFDNLGTGAKLFLLTEAEVTIE